MPALGQLLVANGATLGPGSQGGGSTTGVLAVAGTPQIGTNGTLQIGTGATLSIELGSTGFGGTAGNPGLNDAVSVTGDVTIETATLAGSLLTGFVTNVNDLFFLIINDGSDSVIGTFDGLPQGAMVTLDGPGGSGNFQISYTGNFEAAIPTFTGGNDVVLRSLVTIPEPTSLALLSSGIGLLGCWRRRPRDRGC
jgi:hypothetical protein